MARLEGFDSVRQALTHKAREATDQSVIVGYAGVNYAVYVHEIPPPDYAGETTAKRRARHASGKQWKYLEHPARAMNNDGSLAHVLVRAMGRGVSLVDALVLVGEAIMAASLRIVPVETGNLAGSAFVAKEPKGAT